MTEIIKIFLSLSISGSITALILFALKPILKERVSKTWQYYIWLVVILRLLLPFSFEINIIGKLFLEADRIIADQTINQNTTFSEAIIDFSNTAENPTLTFSKIDNNDILQQEKSIDYHIESIQVLWMLWIGTALMLLVRKITNYHSFVRYIKAGIDEEINENVLEIYKKAYSAMRLKKPLKLYSNKLAVSPMLVGIFKPFIVLPDLKVSEQELYNIFIHELTHYKRLDIFYKWLTQLTVCLHWFNPLIYFVSREINKNCELSCDEVIIKNLNDKEKRSYGDTLLATVKTQGNYSNTIISITLNEDAALLKERLSAIMKFKRKSKLTIAFSGILMTIISSSALFIGAYAQIENTAINDGESAKTGLTYQSQMDTAALSIIEETINWDYVKPLLQYMSPEGITNAINLYIEMAANRELDSSNGQKVNEEISPQPTPHPAEESSNNNANVTESEVALRSSEFIPEMEISADEQNSTEEESTQLTQNLSNHIPITTQSEADAQALEIIQKTGNWRYVEPLLPYMSSEGVDRAALNIMQKTGNWNHIEPMLSYMTNRGVDNVVALWNQKNAGQGNKIASDYYGTIETNNVDTESQHIDISDYNELARISIIETSDLNSIVGFASLVDTAVLDEIVTSHVKTANDFNKTYALRQYMSTDGIDKLVKDYVNRTNDFGTVGAMLQFMSKEESNYVAEKYFRESDRTYDWIFSPYIK